MRKSEYTGCLLGILFILATQVISTSAGQTVTSASPPIPARISDSDSSEGSTSNQSTPVVPELISMNELPPLPYAETNEDSSPIRESNTQPELIIENEKIVFDEKFLTQDFLTPDPTEVNEIIEQLVAALARVGRFTDSASGISILDRDWIASEDGKLFPFFFAEEEKMFVNENFAASIRENIDNALQLSDILSLHLLDLKDFDLLDGFVESVSDLKATLGTVLTSNNFVSKDMQNLKDIFISGENGILGSGQVTGLFEELESSVALLSNSFSAADFARNTFQDEILDGEGDLGSAQLLKLFESLGTDNASPLFDKQPLADKLPQMRESLSSDVQSSDKGLATIKILSPYGRKPVIQNLLNQSLLSGEQPISEADIAKLSGRLSVVTNLHQIAETFKSYRFENAALDLKGVQKDVVDGSNKFVGSIQKQVEIFRADAAQSFESFTAERTGEQPEGNNSRERSFQGIEGDKLIGDLPPFKAGRKFEWKFDNLFNELKKPNNKRDGKLMKFKFDETLSSYRTLLENVKLHVNDNAAERSSEDEATEAIGSAKNVLSKASEKLKAFISKDGVGWAKFLSKKEERRLIDVKPPGRALFLSTTESSTLREELSANSDERKQTLKETFKDSLIWKDMEFQLEFQKLIDFVILKDTDFLQNTSNKLNETLNIINTKFFKNLSLGNIGKQDILINIAASATKISENLEKAVENFKEWSSMLNVNLTDLSLLDGNQLKSLINLDGISAENISRTTLSDIIDKIAELMSGTTFTKPRKVVRKLSDTLSYSIFNEASTVDKLPNTATEENKMAVLEGLSEFLNPERIKYTAGAQKSKLKILHSNLTVRSFESAILDLDRENKTFKRTFSDVLRNAKNNVISLSLNEKLNQTGNFRNRITNVTSNLVLLPKTKILSTSIAPSVHQILKTRSETVKSFFDLESLSGLGEKLEALKTRFENAELALVPTFPTLERFFSEDFEFLETVKKEWDSRLGGILESPEFFDFFDLKDLDDKRSQFISDLEKLKLHDIISIDKIRDLDLSNLQVIESVKAFMSSGKEFVLGYELFANRTKLFNLPTSLSLDFVSIMAMDIIENTKTEIVNLLASDSFTQKETVAEGGETSPTADQLSEEKSKATREKHKVAEKLAEILTSAGLNTREKQVLANLKSKGILN